MKTLYVVVLKTRQNGHVYEVLSNYYFKTEKDARTYACTTVENSTLFSAFEIKDVMPYEILMSV